MFSALGASNARNWAYLRAVCHTCNTARSWHDVISNGAQLCPRLQRSKGIAVK